MTVMTYIPHFMLSYTRMYLDQLVGLIYTNMYFKNTFSIERDA